MLLAIDFSNLLMRNAANPYNTAADSSGNPMTGVVGALSQIRRLIASQNPTNLIVALDPDDGMGFRKGLSERYKAHRSEKDPAIELQFKVGKELVELLGWPSCAISGYEADDVIASAVTQYQGTSVVVSGDKDLLALADNKTSVMLLRPREHVIVDRDVCREIMGVYPNRVRDLKTLMGDASDGILGVKGIGPKTAKKLLAAYGSVGGIYSALDACDGAPVLDGFTKSVVAKIVDGREDARVAYQLVTLVSDLELPCNTRLAEPNAAGIEAMRELGLLNLAQVFNGDFGGS